MINKTKITLAAALIAAFATPALAQHGRTVSGRHQATMTKVRHGAASQGYRTPSDPNAVFVGGSYAGSDPDPNIRAALTREFGIRAN
jgi:hypothetical protein